MSLRRITSLTSIGVALMVLTSYLPAQAAAPISTNADKQASRIKTLLPDDAAAPLQTGTTADAFTATSDDASVTLPLSNPDAATVTSNDGTGLTLDLPDLNVSQGSVAADGTVVYPGTSADLFVQPLDGGVRAGTILNSAEASEKFSYGIDSLQPVIATDGSARFQASTEGGLFEGPSAAAPWAYDANGISVPTHYEVEGDALVQVVEHQDGDYAYPITADPEWGWEGALLWSYFTRSGTKDMSNAGFAAATCAGMVSMIGPVLSALCAANAGSIAYNSSNAYNHGNCAKVTVGPGVVLAQEYRDWRCY